MNSLDSPAPVDRTAPEPAAAALSAARAEGLRYVSDAEPGIRRIKSGQGFRYVGPDGKRISDAAQLARIRSLAIPPAYKDVWICPSVQGHIQATGRDARGRKQYRYHSRWRTHRDGAKFERVLEFGRSLPKIRRTVAQHLRKQGLPREKILGTIVRLLEATLVRVGNEEYARTNGSFGLTTLRDRHAIVNGGTLRFEFRGKSGIVHKVAVADPAMARIVRRCQDIPGQELFQWIDDEGGRHRIDSSDVNDYLREACGQDFTAKDFRTWFATIQALEILRDACKDNQFEDLTEREAKRLVAEAVTTVAARLGNTPTVCRKCYIHPAVLEGFLDGRFSGLNGSSATRCLKQLLNVPKRKSAGT